MKSLVIACILVVCSRGILAQDNFADSLLNIIGSSSPDKQKLRAYVELTGRLLPHLCVNSGNI
ncbi:MAG: hypothetical protein H7122_03735 [Chitinophagaceae bacterium]|nr:hypothetical protein [Chitinophagaceae bacterium]